ncbi:MAG: hypothetical protein RJA36_1616 [Pseudomonadota bacterium]|jgi:hypothetical protein
MKQQEYWRWNLMSETHRKVMPTRYHLTEAEALLIDPKAERVPGTMELRTVPETPDEAERFRTGRSPA